jgi:hypothetical protein
MAKRPQIPQLQDWVEQALQAQAQPQLTDEAEAMLFASQEADDLDVGTSGPMVNTAHSGIAPPDPSTMRTTERFAEGAFKGFGDTMTFGMLPEGPERDLGTAGSVGEFVGFVAGEIPIFLAGGELLSPAFRSAAKTVLKGVDTKLVAKFGKRIGGALKSPVARAEAATAMGVDSLRELLSDDGFDIKGVTGEYGERVAFNLVAPFVPGMFKKPKLDKVTKKAIPDLEAGLEDTGEVITEKLFAPVDIRPKAKLGVDTDQGLTEMNPMLGSSARLGSARLGSARLGSDNPLITTAVSARTAERNVVDLSGALESARSDKALQKFEEMRANLLRGGRRFYIDENVRQALRIEDNLGFDSTNAAAGGILSEGEGWMTAWEVNPDFIPIIERWRQRIVNENPDVFKPKTPGGEVVEGVFGELPPPHIDQIGQEAGGRLSPRINTFVVDNRLADPYIGPGDVVDTLTGRPIPRPRMFQLNPAIEALNSIVVSDPTKLRNADLGPELGDAIARISNLAASTNVPGPSEGRLLWWTIRDNTLQSVAGALERYGDSGKQLALRGLAAREAWTVDSGTALDTITESLEKLSLFSYRKIASTLLGGGEALRPLEQTAVKTILGEVKKVEGFLTQLAPMRKRALKDILTDPLATKKRFLLKGEKPSWSPRKFSGEIAHYLESSYKTIAIARNFHISPEQMLDDASEFGLRTFAPIRKALADAIAEMPGAGKNTMEEYESLVDQAFLTYPSQIRQVAEAVSIGGKWGEAGGILVKQIEAEGGNSHFAEKALNLLVDMPNHDASHAMVSLSHVARGINVITELSLAAIDNLSQSSLTAMRFGTWSTIKEAHDIITDAAYRGNALSFARQSGSVLEDIIRVAEVDFTGPESGSVARAAGVVLRFTGFSFVEKWNRVLAANVGRKYVGARFAELAADPSNVRVWDDLERLGFRKKQLEPYVTELGLTKKGKEAMSAMQSTDPRVMDNAIGKLAGFNASRVTQFLSDSIDNPIVAASPMGKILFQFKTYMINATRFMMRDVGLQFTKGLATGDMKLMAPFLRFLIVGAVVGEGKENVGDVARARNPWKRGKDEFFGFDERNYSNWFRRMVGNQPINNDQDLFEALAQGLTKDTNYFLARRVVENVLSLGNLGLFVGIMQSAVYGGTAGIGEFFAGPTWGKGTDLFWNVLTGNLQATGRRFTRMVPVVGQGIQETFFPTDRQLEHTLFTTFDEQAAGVISNIRQDKEDIYEEALDLSDEGKKQEAQRLLGKWNANINTRLRHVTASVMANRINKKARRGLKDKVIPALTFRAASFKAVIRGREPDEALLERIKNLQLNLQREIEMR